MCDDLKSTMESLQSKESEVRSGDTKNAGEA